MKRIHLKESSPVSPLAGDPDSVQSRLVDQKPIQSNPIRLYELYNFFHCVKCIHTLIYLTFMNISVDFAARNPPKRYMYVLR